MSADITQRLRTRNGSPTGFGIGPVCDAAADEIDALRAEIERLRAESLLIQMQTSTLMDERDAQHAEVSKLAADLLLSHGETERALQQVADLRARLEAAERSEPPDQRARRDDDQHGGNRP